MRLFHFVLTKVCLVQYNMPTVLWNNMLWNKKLILSYHFNFSVLILFVAVAATNDPCSSTFPGRQPFSEPETRAVAEFIMGHSAEWILYLTLHSYSQLWMAPWGYTTDPPHNYRQLVWNFVFSLTFEKNKIKKTRHLKSRGSRLPRNNIYSNGLVLWGGSRDKYQTQVQSLSLHEKFIFWSSGDRRDLANVKHSL